MKKSGMDFFCQNSLDKLWNGDVEAYREYMLRLSKKKKEDAQAQIFLNDLLTAIDAGNKKTYLVYKKFIAEKILFENLRDFVNFVRDKGSLSPACVPQVVFDAAHELMQEEESEETQEYFSIICNAASENNAAAQAVVIYIKALFGSSFSAKITKNITNELINKITDHCVAQYKQEEATDWNLITYALIQQYGICCEPNKDFASELYGMVDDHQVAKFFESSTLITLAKQVPRYPTILLQPKPTKPNIVDIVKFEKLSLVFTVN